jgi:N-acetylneuraminate synthase
MVKAIRDVERALGDGVKGPRPSEIKNKAIARKSLIAAKSINAGEVYSAENIIVKRPGNGASPYLYWELIGKVATKNHAEGEVIFV